MDAIYNKVAEFMTDTVSFYAKSTVDKYNKTTFSNDASSVVGRLIYDISVSESYSSKITHYKELAESLIRRQMRKSPPRPFLNAQALKSTNDRIVDDFNTDFYAGIHDNPNNIQDKRIVE